MPLHLKENPSETFYLRLLDLILKSTVQSPCLQHSLALCYQLNVDVGSKSKAPEHVEKLNTEQPEIQSRQGQMRECSCGDRSTGTEDIL